VTDGPIDWNDFTGRLMYGIKQEGKYQLLRDLSRGTARGQISNAQKGYSCGQDAPYGYDRMLVDESGVERQRVRNGEEVAKPKSWHVEFVISDDPVKVKTLKWIFETYAETGMGLRPLASELNKQGIPSPRGGTWCVGTLRGILTNRFYLGEFAWNKRREGKYHRISKDDIKARTPGERQILNNDESEWIVVPNNHPALIGKKTFRRVQKRLTENRKRTHSHKTRNGDCYILSGILYCAECGAKMYGTRHSRKKNGKTYEYRKYVCSSYHTRGPSKCGYCTIDQGLLLEFLLRKLREAVLCGGHREELRKLIRQRFEDRQKRDPAHVETLRKQLADLDGRIKQGAKRLLAAPDDIADLVAAELSKVRGERDGIACQLEAMENSEDLDIEAETEATLQQLWSIGEELKSAPLPRLRELLRRMVARIDLEFGRKEKGTRVERPFSKGTIDLRPDQVFTDLLVERTRHSSKCLKPQNRDTTFGGRVQKVRTRPRGYEARDKWAPASSLVLAPFIQHLL
jgi:hypothetical protein